MSTKTIPSIWGGLIPTDYIQAWGDTRPEQQARSREVYFHPDRFVYRGGWCDDIKQPEDLLKMFTGLTAINSGYRQIYRQHRDTCSIGTMSTEMLRLGLMSYNALLSHDVQRNVADTPKTRHMQATYDAYKNVDWQLLTRVKSSHSTQTGFLQSAKEGRYIQNLLANHVEGVLPNILVSPFVSTSTEEDVSMRFLTKKGGKRGDPYKSVLITSRLPKQGVFYTPGLYNLPLTRGFDALDPEHKQVDAESEVTIVGGLDPNSIESVAMFDPENRSVLAVVTREADGTVTLLDAVQGAYTVYAFSADGSLRLVSHHDADPSDVELVREKHHWEKRVIYADEEDDSQYYEEDDGYPTSPTMLAKFKPLKIFDND